MVIRNIHHRDFPITADAVGDLLRALSGSDDRLWPRHRWPAMRFDRPLAVGATGGHGPIRYAVEKFDSMAVVFRFNAKSGPAVGLEGIHGFFVEPLGPERTRLVHRIDATSRGAMTLRWLSFFLPLHDALIEDALDCAERALTGTVVRPARHSLRVRLLRALARK